MISAVDTVTRGGHVSYPSPADRPAMTSPVTRGRRVNTVTRGGRVNTVTLGGRVSYPNTADRPAMTSTARFKKLREDTRTEGGPGCSCSVVSSYTAMALLLSSSGWEGHQWDSLFIQPLSLEPDPTISPSIQETLTRKIASYPIHKRFPWVWDIVTATNGLILCFYTGYFLVLAIHRINSPQTHMIPTLG